MFFFFFSKPYISVVGEIVDAQDLHDRAKVQKKLETALEDINRRHEDDISAKFMTTIGDEFQGLVCRGASILAILNEIKNRMHPVKIRFGIGIGEITTEIKEDMAIAAHGPGYEKAREAIRYLRANENKKQTALSDIRVEAVGDHKERMRLINTIFALITALEYSWSDRQREIIYDMMKHQDKQSGAAKRLGITQSTVQKSLTAGKYYTYKEAVDTLEAVFAEIGDDRYDE